MRLNLDVRRVWECPKCGRQRKLAGDVVSQFCRCSAEGGSDGAWMRLVEPKRTVRVDHPRTVHEISCEELAPEATDDQTAVGQVPVGNGHRESELGPEASVSGGDLPGQA